MIDINLIRENPDQVVAGAKAKGVKIDIEKFQELDKEARTLQLEMDILRSVRNQLKPDEAKKRGPEIKEKLQKLEPQLAEIHKELIIQLTSVPNLPDITVPVAPNESGNVVIRKIGQPPIFDFEPKDHVALGEALGILEFERAAKVSGSRFVYRKGPLVLLEFALIRYAYDQLMQEGFVPVLPPVLIRPEPYWGMARLDGDQREERYHIESDDLYLIGSAEHTLGPMHADEILRDDQLPIRYLGFSSCFRREAGSYGQDVRGTLRVHQFDKVEMFSFTKPDESMAELDRLVNFQERLMQGLNLPYQVVQICTGDMGWPDAKQFDLETWLPGQRRYRETHSASNTTNYQARRLKVRFRSKEGKGTEFVHMLNATALALSRTVIAILENYQQADGSITIPEVLQKYTSFSEITANKPKIKSQKSK